MLFYEPHLVQFSKAIGSKPAVFDDLEKCLWKIVVEGPTDLSEQLRSLQTLYLASMEQANCCRAYFLQPPSTHGIDDDDSIASDGPSGERSMCAENSADAWFSTNKRLQHGGVADEPQTSSARSSLAHKRQWTPPPPAAAPKTKRRKATGRRVKPKPKPRISCWSDPSVDLRELSTPPSSVDNVEMQCLQEETLSDCGGTVRGY